MLIVTVKRKKITKNKKKQEEDERHTTTSGVSNLTWQHQLVSRPGVNLSLLLVS